MTYKGFCKAVLCVLRIRKGGLLWSGCPCSSFVWLARGTSGRSAETPYGNPDAPSAVLGNALFERSLLLAILAIARGVHIATEQPGSSLMTLYPGLLRLQQCLGDWHETRFWMALYGHSSPKATKVFGTWSEAQVATLQLAIKHCAGTQRMYINNCN